MSFQFQEMVPPRQLRPSPIRETNMQHRFQISSQTRRLRPPGGLKPLGNIVQLPTASRLQPTNPLPMRLPPSKSFGSFQPQEQSTQIHGSTSSQKVIPLPGFSNVLASIPRPSRRPELPTDLSKHSAPVRIPVSLLPKPGFMQSERISKIRPSSRFQSRTYTVASQCEQSSPQSPPSSTGITLRSVNPTTPISKSRVVFKTPARKPPVQLPRTAAKQRLSTEDADAEVFHIAGRDIQFVDWAPSPESPPAPKPVKRPVVHAGKAKIAKGLVRAGAIEESSVRSALPPPLAGGIQATNSTKKGIIYEFPDEPLVAATKEFASQIESDLQRFQRMGVEMSELKQRKAAILSKIQSTKEEDSLNIGEFRTKYGITQSPKMRQLLELTGEWNRAILEKRELEHELAKAQPFVIRPRIKLVQSLQSLIENPGESPEIAQRRLAQEKTKKERIETYQRRKDADREYRRLLEERKKKIASRRPYSKEERKDIKQRYQQAQAWTYTAPTEEELDSALKMAEIMELEEKGLSIVADPEKTVKELFPGVVPSAVIHNIVGNTPIPMNIPTEDINTTNSLDRTTAEIALKASLLPIPAEGVAKNVLNTSLQEIATSTIETSPQQLDPIYAIDLKLNQPKHMNYIQLQGSSTPSWFPGYYSIFPGAPGLIKAMKSPSITLLTAFRQMQISPVSPGV